MKQGFFLFDDIKEEIKRRELTAAKSVKPSEITLRPYQSESVDNVFSEFETNRATLVCLPTGCGKSIVFSEVMRRWTEQ